MDEPLVWYEGAALTDRRWLVSDQLGSVIAQTDAAGTTTRHAYGPYGEPASWEGPRFRYTGQIALPEARLHHYKARVYDPVLGRFLQTDPVGYEDDLNLYGYVLNDPMNRTDPTGRVWIYSSARENAHLLDEALSYLSESATFGAEFGAVASSEQTYVLRVDPTADITNYNPETRVLTWNPYLGTTGSEGVQSPAANLGHDVSHVAEHDRIGTEQMMRNLRPQAPVDAVMDEGNIVLRPSPEEVRATEVGNRIAGELREPQRRNYTDAVVTTTRGPTSREPRPSSVQGGGCGN